jgi:hypothetical protein
MIAWLFVVFSGAFVVFLASSAIGPPAYSLRELSLSALSIALLLTFNLLEWRVPLAGVAVDSNALLVRRAFPGWVEKISLERIRYCRVRRWWLNSWLIVKGHGVIPSVLSSDRGPFGLETVKGWDEMIAALREKLEPLGKWRG